MPLREISLEAIQRYDERHEISPRPHFLELWLRQRAGNVFVARDPQGECHGYVRIRPSLLPIGEGWRVGPWLVEDADMASLLLNNALDRHKGVVLIDTRGIIHLPIRSLRRRASNLWARLCACTRA